MRSVPVGAHHLFCDGMGPARYRNWPADNCGELGIAASGEGHQNKRHHRLQPRKSGRWREVLGQRPAISLHKRYGRAYQLCLGISAHAVLSSLSPRPKRVRVWAHQQVETVKSNLFVDPFFCYSTGKLFGCARLDTAAAQLNYPRYIQCEPSISLHNGS